MANFYDELNLNQNQLKQAVVENLTAPPSTPVGGQIYFDSTNQAFYIYRDGSVDAWARLDSQSMTVADIVTIIGTTTTDISVNSKKITSLGAPSSDTDAATKKYVDDIAKGLDIKSSVRAASTAELSTLNGTQSVGGVSLVDGDRVLLKNQTTDPTQNGIYVVNGSGAWTRATDADPTNFTLTFGAFTFVEEGDNKGKGYVYIDSNSWTQFSENTAIVAGNGISVSGSTVGLDLSVNGGLEIVTTGTEEQKGLQAKLSSTGGLKLETTSGQEGIAIDNVSVAKGGTGNTTFTNGQYIVYDAANTKLISKQSKVVSTVSVTSIVGTPDVETIDTSALNTTDVLVTVKNASGEIVYPKVEVVSATQVKVTFSGTISTQNFTVTVVAA